MLISTKAGVSHFMAAILRRYPRESRGPGGPKTVGKPFAGGQFLEYPCAMSRLPRALFIVALLAPLARPAAARAAALLYVSGEDSGVVIVVDADKGEVAARIPVGKRPRGM